MARNPFRSEAEAYRFLLLTVGYFALIVAAAAIATWLGVVVFVVLTRGRDLAVAAVALGRAGAADGGVAAQRRGRAPDPRGRERDRRRRRAADDPPPQGGGSADRLLVVCPALNSQLRTWASDEDGARAAAQQRLDASLAQLRRDDIEAEGEVGDGDPLQAMEDALRTFGADEIVISTHPEGRSHWLERDVVGAARERFDVPITHVVVDLEALEA